MAKPLFKLFSQWEIATLGSTGLDLQNRQFLQSELSWLNLYLCQTLNREKSSFSQANMTGESVSASSWALFPSHLYLHVDKSLLSKICNTAISFLEWSKENSPEDHFYDIAKGAIQSAKKDIERLIKVYRHFNERQNTWVYWPSPTESLEDISWNEDIMKLQMPTSSDTVSDTFELVSKHPTQTVGYFKALSSQKPVVVQLDEKCAQLLEHGDQLPLTLMSHPDGLYYLEFVGYPILPSFPS
jgi:hypothetical protein